MTETVTIPREELTNLEERIRVLAQEKSYQQLLIGLMSSMNSVPGLDNAIDIMLKNTLDVVGGNNLILYYWIDDDIYYADVLGTKKKLDDISDLLVNKVIKTFEPVEFEHDFSETRMITKEFSKAFTWAVPLTVGSDLVGILKMEGLHIGIGEMHQQLPTFFSYVALVIKNEIQGQTRLKKAYDSLEEEVILRRQVEEELHLANETLETRVAERTSELKDANTRLQCELTRRIQAEKFISLLHFALNNVREAAFLIDEYAHFHFVNEEACRILGYGRDELLTMSVSDIDPDFPHERWPEHWNDLRAHHALTFEGRHQTKEGHIFPVEINANYLEYDNNGYNLALVRDITERKQAESERLAHFHFLQHMDQINRALMKTDNLEDMMTEVLNTLLSILGCDRSWIACPCDPEAASCRVLMECTRPEYPGALAMGVKIPIDPEVARIFRTVRASDGPVKFGPDSEHPLPATLVEPFVEQSQIAMALYPKGDTPYIFGLHQCSHPRIWTDEEVTLFQEVGRRLTDSLNMLLMYHNLQMSEIKYRTLFEESFDGLFITSPAGKILEMNRKGIEMFGYDTKEEILSLDLARDVYAYPPDRKRILAMVNEHGSAEYEVVVKKKSGEKMDTLCSLTAEKDETGTILNYRGIIRDITMRKRREEELTRYQETLEELVKERTLQLEESENLYHSLFTNMTEGFALHEIICNEKGEPYDYRFIEINPIFEHLTGLNREDLIGRTVYEILPDNEPHWINTYGSVALTGQPVHFENRSASLNRDYEVYAYSPVPGQFATIFTDITERKHSEEKISKLNKDLQNRAIDLEAVNEELEAFVYSVSHDLRAPLRHIEGFMELLWKKNVTLMDTQSQHYMTVISDSSSHMGTMIDDLLSFSRMSRQEMISLPVNLDSLLREVLQSLEFETQGRNIGWSVARLPAVTGDCSMLRIVFINLISNALKFTKKQEKAEIEIGCLPDREKEVLIFVRDNGVGFDMKYADKLFGVFQRLHRAEEFEGTGIGLANIRRIINRHGGKTWAEGEVGRGATVYFSLPITEKGE